MRDILVLGIVFALLPAAIAHPYVGVLLWTWVSVMNPHKLAWGVAVHFPIALVVAVATLIGVFFTKDERRFPFNAVTICLLVFIGWMCLTSVFAIYPSRIAQPFERVLKIQIMILVTLLLVHTREKIHGVLIVMVLSLAFFGVKGGIYTLTGGRNLVYGPEGGFFEENNALALALIMTIPLLFYLFQEVKWQSLKWAILAMTVLCAAGALGTHSRGGFLAIGAMSMFLWLKSQNKLLSLGPILLTAVILIGLMPERWSERMHSIPNYEHDSSALGRINAWMMSYNLAKDRFLGGGFEVITPELFARYAPNPTGVHAAHSIYFQVLGEHGFVGLGLFLLLWFLVWRTASSTSRQARQVPELRWAARLCTMIQVSLIGYFVGGAFLSLAYFDVPYNLLALVVATRVVVQRHVAAAPVSSRAHPSLQPAS